MLNMNKIGNKAIDDLNACFVSKMTETRTIEIPVYRDKDGKPVCYVDNIYCKLSSGIGYGLRCHGCETVISQDDIRCGVKNSIEWNGYFPHKNCPLWVEELKNA